MSLKVVDNTSHVISHRRNPGYPLDLDWVERVRMNRSALERRAGSIGARRTVKKDYQLAWLLKAGRCVAASSAVVSRLTPFAKHSV